MKKKPLYHFQGGKGGELLMEPKEKGSILGDGTLKGAGEILLVSTFIGREKEEHGSKMSLLPSLLKREGKGI